MAYIPLTKEQYQKAINSGYSPEQIIANEKIRKEKSVEVEQGVTSTGMFPIDETQEEQQAKIKEYQAIADKSKKEADFASSPLGMITNFGKAFGKNIAYSEVLLGNTIAGIINTKHLESYNKNITDLTELNIKLLKQIETLESEGKDATALKKQYNQTQQLINENINKIEEIQGGVSKTTGQVLGEIEGTALDVLTAGTYGKLAAGARTGFLSPIKTPTVKSVSTAISPELGQISTLKPSGLFSKSGIGNVAKGGGIGYSFDVAQNLQEGKTGGEAFTPGLGTVVGSGIPLISESPKSFQQIKNSFTPFYRPIAGIGQNIKEGVQTIPRVVERFGAGLEKSADKATRLKAATPEVKKAIESGLDDKIISFVTEADDATKDAMKKVVRMAEEKPVLGKTNQPSVVAGDLAVKQYNLIDAEKKRIGKQLGDRINALSKTTTVDIKDSLKSLDDILNSQGILKTYNKKGDVVLDFGTSKFTKAERAKISELYELATEGGSKLTPAQIKAKDQLFSKMQRESKMESIGDIIIDTPEGQKNLFQAFRDVYNSKLDSIDPTIRELNRKYAEMARITDDIEDSIFKTPNFNATKSADQSEFAKVNLRRIFAENQSSAVYEDIVNQMDDWARVLGYKDASPKEIMDFSLEMRRLFPETVPKTGFTGGINAGVESTIINTLGKALTSGKPNLIDQQKALKALLGIDDVILPKLNKPLNPGSKIDINLPKNKVDKVNKEAKPTAKEVKPIAQPVKPEKGKIIPETEAKKDANLPKLNQVIEPSSKIDINLPKIKSPERINYLERYNINKTELLQDKDVIFTKFFNELKKNEPKFISITEDIASKFGGEYVYRMKSPESISIKMGRRGDKFTLGNVDDALGSTVITNDIDGALAKAKKDYKITNVDDFRKKPTFLGYKAVHLDVELPNGQIAEIQLNTRAGLIRKEEGHKTYEKWRKYIENAQGTTLDDILKKIPKDLKDEFLKDVEYSIGIFEGKIPVPEEVIKLVEKRIIKTKNPLSSIMNNKKQPS